VTTRLIRKNEVMERLGIRTYSTFNELMKTDNAPKPVIAKGKFSLWDYSAIEQFLDRMGNINKQSTDWDKIATDRLAKRGKHQSAVSSH
jgi:predicted DNA-binding transcriptional regulator AlpA